MKVGFLLFCFFDQLTVLCENALQVGQSHGGMFGVVQRALARATSHIWFDRSEIKDRALVAQRYNKLLKDDDKQGRVPYICLML